MKVAKAIRVQLVVQAILVHTLLGFGQTTQADDSIKVRSVSGYAAYLKNLKNWGLTNSETQSHMHAVEAWTIEEGKKDVIVAVVDTGIDPYQPALAGNLWHNDRENLSSVYGWNFVDNAANPLDDNGHGTHVAGIIGAMADLKDGISGVAHHVSIMPVKYYSESNSGSVNLYNTIQAINYAVDHGARIINYSGGGPQYSAEEFKAIKRAEAKGVLFVSAAGNERQNTDEQQNFYYPAAYHLSNIMTVAATNIHNDLLNASNWGFKSVDVAAPGEAIYSTMPHNKFGYMSGTSQATAFVSGLAALLLSHEPRLTPQEIKSIIMASVDVTPQLRGRVASEGKINAYRALLELERRMRASNLSDSPEKVSASTMPIGNSLLALQQ